MSQALNLRLGIAAIFFASTLLLLSNEIQAQQKTSNTTADFKLTLASEITSQPIDGRLYLFFSQRPGSPINGPNWFLPEPFFGKDVSGMKPGDSITFDQSILGFPASLADLKSGKYQVQALLDYNFDFADHKDGVGNFYSKPVSIEFKNGAANEPVELVLDQVIEKRETEDSDTFKFVSLESKLLSEFHDRKVIERAGVLLPPSYGTDPNRRYPVYYDITGFGGTLEGIQRRYSRRNNAAKPADDKTEFIKVFLTGQCNWGHHVYANSATNGPRGDALIQELIPHIDSQFRTISQPTARFVGGHSSGGWSSLWLQVAYPDSFGGVWSTAPDPVDFRDWQGTNIYENESVFFEADGSVKPLARVNGRVMLTYPGFCKMDDALGEGGQLRSFEAVFSPLGDDGKPKQCWDRESGKPDPEVVEYWKRYDISRILNENWSQLEPKLAGKIHVYMGDVDTFYLEGATRLLGERMKELGSDANIEMFPGKDHMNLLSPDLRARIDREMTAKFLENHPEKK